MQSVYTDGAPGAIGPYSQAILAGEFLFISGQVPIQPSSGKVECEDIEGQTKQVMANLKAILNKADLNFSHVVKSTIFLKDLNDFKTVNEIYGSFFTPPYPARATIQVAKLPLDVRVEIEMVAHSKPK